MPPGARGLPSISEDATTVTRSTYLIPAQFLNTINETTSYMSQTDAAAHVQKVLAGRPQSTIEQARRISAIRGKVAAQLKFGTNKAPREPTLVELEDCMNSFDQEELAALQPVCSETELVP